MKPRPAAGQAILIPVKSLDRAKLRLSGKLKPQDRRRLGLAMLADVLKATEKWDHRFIVTADPDAEAVGLAFGCHLVADDGSGLNAALAAGTRAAVGAGVRSLLILPSDVPMVLADDVTALFCLPHNVVIAPSGDGGTNGLLRNPPDCLEPAFGPGSAQTHRAGARRAGLSRKVAPMDSLTLDIDRYADLVRLGRLAGARDSVRLAAELVGLEP